MNNTWPFLREREAESAARAQAQPRSGRAAANGRLQPGHAAEGLSCRRRQTRRHSVQGAGLCMRTLPERRRPAAHSPCRWLTTALPANACAVPFPCGHCRSPVVAALARGPRTAP